jgi:hypothetical protein
MEKYEPIWIPLAMIVSGFIGFWGNRILSRANANAVDIKSLQDLSKRVEEQAESIHEIQTKFLALDKKISIMWQYIYALVEQIRKLKKKPIPPPKELESDPILVKLFK